MGSSSSIFSTPKPRMESRTSPYSLLALYVFLTLIVYLIAVYRREKRRGEDVKQYVRGRRGRGKRGKEKDDNSRTVLIVTAHPDDECLFFAPAILTLNSNPHTDVHILCLSNGDYHGDGHEREKELETSCAILGIPACNVTVLNESELQDDPHARWDEELVSRRVLRQIIKCEANMVLTFDESGVSSHPNHIAAYRGVRKLVKEQKLPSGVRAFCLESITIWRRFISFLEVPISFVLSAIRGNKVVVSSPQGVLRAQRAMRAHATQFVWFRLLNIVFSRYLIINTIKTIKRSS